VIAPSFDYMDRAWEDARHSGFSRDPVVEMLIPSTLDDTLAPEGHHVASLFCQQFNPGLGEDQHWGDLREQAADTVIAAVEHRARGFRQSILGRQVFTPLDLQRRFGLTRGDIFQGRPSLDQLFSARPVLGHGDYRMPLAQLYLCGAGALRAEGLPACRDAMRPGRSSRIAGFGHAPIENLVRSSQPGAVGVMACMGQSRMPRSRSDPDQPRLQYERVRMPGEAER